MFEGWQITHICQPKFIWVYFFRKPANHVSELAQPKNNIGALLEYFCQA
jgi:hypothetical protein